MLIRGDARQIPLRDGCVQTVVTSPPYFGMRDYNAPGQIGLEPTPEAYVSALVAVFREVRRVLKPDGTCWVNLGSTYASGDTGPSQSISRTDVSGMVWVNYTFKRLIAAEIERLQRRRCPG